MKIALWGAGAIGKRILSKLSNDVVAFIDSDETKIGGHVEGVPIISYEELRKTFPEIYILVTPLACQEIVAFLDQHEENRYFLATDLPGEWLDVNPRTEYFDYLSRVIKRGMRWCVYGVNYHSIKLLEFITKCIGESGALVKNSYANNKLCHLLKCDLGIEIIDLEEAKLNNFDIVYVASDDYRKGAINAMEIETWDCMEKIATYHKPYLKCFKNRHKGRRCFIIGNGPSLSAEDLNMLGQSNELCFGVNSIFKIYDKTNWRPDYYVSGDIAFLTENGVQCVNLARFKEGAFLFDRLPPDFYVDLPKNVFVVHTQSSVAIRQPPKFSTDASKGVYYGATVLYQCMQLAVYMGVSKIYLLGVDFTGGVKSFTSNNKHFYDVKSGGALLYNHISFLAYQSAKDYGDKHAVNIYNATRGGELEVFPRVDFDSLFN